MMRVNQFNSNAFTQNTQNRNNRTSSNMQSFAGVMSNVSGQQQPAQMMPQQSNTMQMPGIGEMSGISGMPNNFPPMMPEMPSGDMPAMPDGETPPAMPDGETPPAMPDGETPPAMPDGETPPAMPDGETPPAMPDGETPPAMPDGETPPEIPSGETPATAPSESDGNMPQPPFGGMQRPGGFSNPFGGGMNSFRAMNFLNR